MPRRRNRVCATRTWKCPEVLHSKTINVTCPSQHFPLRHVSGWEGPNTQAGYFDRIPPVLRRVLHACRELRARRRIRHSKEDYDRLVPLLWGWWTVALEVKSRFDFSCCIWFWFGSRHLKCDTTAILRPRPPSSIRKEFKARTLTFFFPRWKSKVSVPWWYCGTTEVVSGGRPREIPDLLCSNAIDVFPPASFLTRTLELITNQGRTTLGQYEAYSKQI